MAGAAGGRETRRVALVVSCEHGGNRVPAPYRSLFEGAAGALESHRGYDAGALEVARALASAGRAPLVAARTTRLLVDLNRSLHHPKLYSELSRGLAGEQKQRLLARHYLPHRARVESLVADGVSRGCFVLHVASHSFTPVLGGRERRADVALLYDPRRASEKAFADAWLDALAEASPGWRLRRNFPYRGTADGLTTHLRRRFDERQYAGLELEVSQRLVGSADWPGTVRALAASLTRVLAARGAASLLAQGSGNRRRWPRPSSGQRPSARSIKQRSKDSR
ncbi:MAG TPA: N-formylglutamate amidohydrolase [Gammaproteobacteria bacterium]|nr:N-formylglutamate amidohydrolase [Gammaproteobacteria bacterium]